MKIKTSQVSKSLISKFLICTLFFSAILLVTFTLNTKAQVIDRPTRCAKKPPETIPAPLLSTHIPEYSDKMRILRARVRDFRGSEEERVKFQIRLIKELEEDFKQMRTSKYEAAQFKVLTKHSCSTKSGFKDCKEKCAYAPDRPNMYTNAELLCYTGTQKGIEVIAKGQGACLKMTRAGKGVNRGGIHVLFKYKPEAVTSFTENDWTTFLPLIG